jgi:hypothetical protein
MSHMKAGTQIFVNDLNLFGYHNVAYEGRARKFLLTIWIFSVTTMSHMKAGHANFCERFESFVSPQSREYSKSVTVKINSNVKINWILFIWKLHTLLLHTEIYVILFQLYQNPLKCLYFDDISIHHSRNVTGNLTWSESLHVTWAPILLGKLPLHLNFACKLSSDLVRKVDLCIQLELWYNCSYRQG